MNTNFEMLASFALGSCWNLGTSVASIAKHHHHLARLPLPLQLRVPHLRADMHITLHTQRYDGEESANAPQPNNTCLGVAPMKPRDQLRSQDVAFSAHSSSNMRRMRRITQTTCIDYLCLVESIQGQSGPHLFRRNKICSPTGTPSVLLVRSSSSKDLLMLVIPCLVTWKSAITSYSEPCQSYQPLTTSNLHGPSSFPTSAVLISDSYGQHALCDKETRRLYLLIGACGPRIHLVPFVLTYFGNGNCFWNVQIQAFAIDQRTHPCRGILERCGVSR